MLRCTYRFCSILFFSGSLLAQSSVLFVTDETARPLGPSAGYGATGQLRPGEIGLVVPVPGTSYHARPFLGAATQWAFIGDMDTDADFVESPAGGPGDGIDALLVRRHGTITGPATPRSVFVSVESDAGFGTTVEDGDVFRYAGQGTLEFFLRESQLRDALGTTTDVDLDAICQDQNGALFLSINLSLPVNGGMADDGAIIRIPATAITYDPVTGCVASVTMNSAQLVASEADVRGWIQNSGVKDITGMPPAPGTTDIDLSALELDPNGGVFNAPQNSGILVPNLLFSWRGSNVDGALCSTNGGGQIAVINAVLMGNQTATSGTHLGLLPSPTGVGGIDGLALPAFQTREPFLLEIYPEHSLSASSPRWTRQEVAGATPFGIVVFFLDGAVGGNFPSLEIPGFEGSLYGAGIWLPTTAVLADVGGGAAASLNVPSSFIGSGNAVVWQALDLTALRLAWPAAQDF